MKSFPFRLLVVLAGALILIIPAYSQAGQKSQPEKTSLPDSVFFYSLVAVYVQAVDQADTVLASKLWSPTAEISFINPKGTAYGWKEIKKIYQTFKVNFTARKLSFSDLKFAYYGDVSWLTFSWTFNATLKSDRSPVQTRGRETQIWRKINYEWRLVHVHYSEMPVSDR